MRFANFLLVASAALLSSSIAVSAGSGDVHVKLPTMTSTDAAVAAFDTNNGKRLLRSHQFDDYDEEDEDDLDEEERATAEQLAKWAVKVEDWIKQGYKPAGMKDKLTPLNGVMSEKNKEKYKMFLAAWGPRNRNALDRI